MIKLNQFRGVQNCHHFYERTQSMLGGRGSKAAVRFFEMLLMVHCDFERGLKINIFSIVLVGRRVTTTTKTLYALENVDNSGRPLTVKNYVANYYFSLE